MKEYYDGGILKAEYQTKKGQKSGLYKEYYRDGSIMAKGHLENNLREGPWTYFTKNSQVKATGTYSSGLKTGIWIYDDGEKKVSWGIFKSEAHNFLINVPTTWKTETPLENVVQFTPTNLNGLPNNLTLVFTELDSTFSLTQLFEQNKQSAIKNFADRNIKVLNTGELEINGFESYWVLYNLNYSGQPINQWQHSIKRKNELVIVTCTAERTTFKEMEDIYKEIVLSLFLGQ